MSYEVLVGIVVVNLAVTLWLWAMLEYKASVKADTPPRTVLSRRLRKNSGTASRFTLHRNLQTLRRR